MKATSEIRGLYLLAAKVGHRTPAGHHCYNVKALVELVPEHDNQARRQMEMLPVQVAGLKKSLSDLPSHDRGSDARDQAQRPGDRA